MIPALARRLSLEPEETRHALGLGAILFGLSASYTLVKTVRDALFLAKLPATVLPYVFVGVGVVTLIAALGYTRLTRGVSTGQALAGGAMVAGVSLGVFARVLDLSQHWVPVIFYVWVNVYGLILLSQFWAFANTVCHPREARKIFGMVGAGGILGGLFGGLLAAPLARLWTLPSLLMVAAVASALLTPGVMWSLRAMGAVAPEPVGEEKSSTENPLKHRYVRWLAVATLCSVMVTGLLDYQFKVEIQRRYPTAEALASFLGLFYTAMNLAALGLQVFGARLLLQGLGASRCAALLPAGLGLGTVIVAMAPGFWSIFGTKLWDQVLRISVNKVAGELFYFPLESRLRRRAKALIDSSIERLGDGFAGILILVATASIGRCEVGTVAALTGALLVAWAAAWLGVRRGYVRELGKNLRRLNLDHAQTRTSLREASLLREMASLLASPYERVVLQSLAMLEENAPEILKRRLGDLLTHSSPRVRARALALVRLNRDVERVEQVSALLGDADRDVRVEALRTLVALRSHDLVGQLEQYLRSPDPQLRATAILSATEHARPAEEDQIRSMLESVLSGGAPPERLVVAEALGRRSAPSTLHDLLTPLLEDDDLAVRTAALRSAGRAQRRNYIAILIDALAERPTRAAAQAALVEYGDRVVGTLGDYLSDTSVPIEIRIEIPRVLSEIQSQEAVDALFRCRDRGDLRLVYRVVKGASRIRAAEAPVTFPEALITQDIDHDVWLFLTALVHYRASPLGAVRSAERLLCKALNERMDHALNRIFRRLALVYRPREVRAAYEGVISDDPHLKGHALEYLENALADAHRQLVLPLVDDLPESERLLLAESRGVRSSSFVDTLAALIRGEDAWLRTLALHVAGTRKERTLLELVEGQRAARDPRVRQTADWAHLALAAS